MLNSSMSARLAAAAVWLLAAAAAVEAAYPTYQDTQCVGDTLRLRCDAQHRIQVIHVIFGRPGPPPGPPGLVQGECVFDPRGCMKQDHNFHPCTGLQMCTVRAPPTQLPGCGLSSYAHVTYNCIPAGEVHDVCAVPGGSMAAPSGYLATPGYPRPPPTVAGRNRPGACTVTVQVGRDRRIKLYLLDAAVGLLAELAAGEVDCRVQLTLRERGGGAVEDDDRQQVSLCVDAAGGFLRNELLYTSFTPALAVTMDTAVAAGGADKGVLLYWEDVPADPKDEPRGSHAHSPQSVFPQQIVPQQTFPQAQAILDETLGTGQLFLGPNHDVHSLREGISRPKLRGGPQQQREVISQIREVLPQERKVFPTRQRQELSPETEVFPQQRGLFSQQEEIFPGQRELFPQQREIFPQQREVVSNQKDQFTNQRDASFIEETINNSFLRNQPMPPFQDINQYPQQQQQYTPQQLEPVIQQQQPTNRQQQPSYSQSDPTLRQLEPNPRQQQPTHKQETQLFEKSRPNFRQQEPTPIQQQPTQRQQAPVFSQAESSPGLQEPRSRPPQPARKPKKPPLQTIDPSPNYYSETDDYSPLPPLSGPILDNYSGRSTSSPVMPATPTPTPVPAYSTPGHLGPGKIPYTLNTNLSLSELSAAAQKHATAAEKVPAKGEAADSGATAVISGVLSGVAVLLILVVLAILFLQRYRQQKAAASADKDDTYTDIPAPPAHASEVPAAAGAPSHSGGSRHENEYTPPPSRPQHPGHHNHTFVLSEVDDGSDNDDDRSTIDLDTVHPPDPAPRPPGPRPVVPARQVGLERGRKESKKNKKNVAATYDRILPRIEEGEYEERDRVTPEVTRGSMRRDQTSPPNTRPASCKEEGLFVNLPPLPSQVTDGLTLHQTKPGKPAGQLVVKLPDKGSACAASPNRPHSPNVGSGPAAPPTPRTKLIPPPPPTPPPPDSPSPESSSSSSEFECSSSTASASGGSGCRSLATSSALAAATAECLDVSSLSNSLQNLAKKSQGSNQDLMINIRLRMSNQQQEAASPPPANRKKSKAPPPPAPRKSLRAKKSAAEDSDNRLVPGICGEPQSVSYDERGGVKGVARSLGDLRTSHADDESSSVDSVCSPRIPRNKQKMRASMNSMPLPRRRRGSDLGFDSSNHSLHSPRVGESERSCSHSLKYSRARTNGDDVDASLDHLKSSGNGLKPYPLQRKEDSRDTSRDRTHEHIDDVRSSMTSLHSLNRGKDIRSSRNNMQHPIPKINEDDIISARNSLHKTQAAPIVKPKPRLGMQRSGAVAADRETVMVDNVIYGMSP